MQEQVQELIEEMIPQEVLKELRPQYETQYQEQLNQAMQEIKGTKFKEQQIEEKKRELAQQILYQIEQEFEQEKQSLIHNVSVSLSKSRSMQVLEQQYYSQQQRLRAKIEKEYAGYVDEETRKKTHLIRLNCQKKFEEDRAEMKLQLTEDFTEKLQIHLQQLEQTKQQLTQEYQNQKEKLSKIETEAQQFQQMKNTQENNYGEQIQSLHDQIQMLTEQLQKVKALKIPKKQPAKKQPTENEEIQQQTSPFQSALKNQVLQDCIPYEGMNIINFEQPPDLFHLETVRPTQKKDNQIQQYESNQMTKSDLAYTVNTQINTHDSQVISFNVSQPSMAKTNPHVTQTHIAQTVNEKEKENQYSQNKDPISIKENDFKKSSISNQSAIIEKLENLCKEKTRKSQVNAIQKQSKILLPQDQFEELFKPDSKDSQYTRNIKLLRQELQEKFIEDLQLEDYYYEQISFLKFNFIQQFQKSLQPEITEQVHQLTSVWNKGHLSYSERIEYIKRIMETSDSQSELAMVLEECLEYFQQNELLIEKLQQRQSFRSQIIKENCLIQKNKKIFSALRGLTYEIKQILKNKFFWREVDVDSILMIDQLEQQLIEREEMKEDIRKKVEKKFK